MGRQLHPRYAIYEPGGLLEGFGCRVFVLDEPKRLEVPRFEAATSGLFYR